VGKEGRRRRRRRYGEVREEVEVEDGGGVGGLCSR
jgi:hypothetical protein